MVSIPRYDDLATALREENIDIVAGVNDDDNTEIDKIVAMTAPYMTTSRLLVYNKFVDPDRLDGKSIALYGTRLKPPLKARRCSCTTLLKNASKR